jgi:hypothetical protein
MQELDDEKRPADRRRYSPYAVVCGSYGLLVAPCNCATSLHGDPHIRDFPLLFFFVLHVVSFVVLMSCSVAAFRQIGTYPERWKGLDWAGFGMFVAVLVAWNFVATFGT